MIWKLPFAFYHSISELILGLEYIWLLWTSSIVASSVWILNRAFQNRTVLISWELKDGDFARDPSTDTCSHDASHLFCP
jgi:hypothetical protein